MKLCVSLILFLVSLPAFLAKEVGHASFVVDGTVAIAHTDKNFVCATLDWWNHEKCDYNHCPWGYASVLNLNLSHPLLAKSIQAFNQLRIRIGGSLQDQVLYGVGDLKSPCHPFKKQKGGLFGFSTGCLSMSRWDELNQFFSKTRPLVTFSLNALSGRHHKGAGVWVGNWDSSNAYDFIKYTVSKGYQINSWELGNELCGKGVGASVGAEQYGKDMIQLKHIVSQLYKYSHMKPAIAGPGGFYDQKWFATLLQVSGPGVVDAVTQHIYNLGPGVDPTLMQKILDPFYLDHISGTFDDLAATVRQHGHGASIWVGESGGAYNSGGYNVSNTFVNSFWYLDQLGMSATHSTAVYCRQSLVGGHYGLLNRTSFVPNPDYYSAILWHRLMGESVLAVKRNGAPHLRVYAHCSKGSAGVTLLLINLSNQTDFTVDVKNVLELDTAARSKNTCQGSKFSHGLKRTISWVGLKASDAQLHRKEYHLTPKDGDLRSKIMVLNGVPLEITKDGNIPELEPVLVPTSSPISITSFSIKFIVLTHFEAPACG